MRLKLLALVYLLVTVTPVAAVETEGLGKVKGQVAWEDISRYRGVAALWENCDSATGGLVETIGDPEFVVELAADGRFEVEAPAGDYCLGVVVKRSAGNGFGPPEEKDLIFMTPGPNGEVFPVRLERGKTLDVGRQTEAWVFERPQAPQ